MEGEVLLELAERLRKDVFRLGEWLISANATIDADCLCGHDSWKQNWGRASFVALTDQSFTCTPASHTTKRRGAAVAAPNNCIGRSDLQLT
jgi:hypothetical protein